MKKFFFAVLCFSLSLFSQQEMVGVEHPVYNFLARMEILKVISGYNHFEKPMARMEVAAMLNSASEKKSELSLIDQQMLDDFRKEFWHELKIGAENSSSTFTSGDYSFFSEKENYFYSYSDDSNNALFINLIADGAVNYSSGAKETAVIGNAGGKIRGTVADLFSFEMQGMNGYVWGSRATAKTLKPILKHNFKFNGFPESNFFDDAYGSISLVRKNFRMKFGNDNHQIGYGMMTPFLKNNSPRVASLSLAFKIGIMNFSSFHGKLLGKESAVYDSAQGVIKNVSEKYLAYHRFSFEVSKDFSFGLGEMTIYGNRSADFAYLIPFNFYKSAEHANRDRDNSMLFIDLNSTYVKNLFSFATLLIDDIDYGKLGSDWFGNQFLFHAGIHSYNFYQTFPAILKAEYVRIDPYVFTHRIANNNFTSQSIPLGIEFQPNSENYNLGLEYYFNYRLKSELCFSYSEHGANPLNSDGTVARNVGGDINFGHREFDSKSVKFLDGDLEINRQFSLIIIYEPLNNIFLNFILKKANETKTAASSSNFYFFTTLKLLL